MKNKILNAIHKGMNMSLGFDIDSDDDNFSIKKAKVSSKNMLTRDKLQNEMNDLVNMKEYEKALKMYLDYGIKFTPVNEQNLKEILSPFDNDTFKDFNLNWINVSEITDMSYLFIQCWNFNCDISQWDVSNVTNMNSMFGTCWKFNCDISNWNVSKVTNMSGMFDNCEMFNQPLNKWNVSNVNDMSNMFRGCTHFNQPLNEWDVSKVENMESMFDSCYNFNQPLNSWNISNVKNLNNMFDSCFDFNQPLDKWDISNVTTMKRMFADCEKFKQDLSGWTIYANKCDFDGMISNTGYIGNESVRKAPKVVFPKF